MAGTADEAELRAALQQFFEKNLKVKAQVLDAKVESVDWDKKSCTVKTEDGIEFFDVRLRAVIDGAVTGITVKPKVNSDVLIAVIENMESNVFVCQYTEFDELEIITDNLTLNIDSKGKVKLKCKNLEIDADQTVLNGGGNDGLVMLNPLVTDLNSIKTDLNKLKAAMSAWTPVPQDGGAALKTAAAAWYGQDLATTQKDDLENKKVTQ